MASVEELIVKLAADNSDLKKKLAESERGIKGLASNTKTSGIAMQAAFAAIGVAIGAFARKAFIAWEEQEKANKKLMSSLNGDNVAFKQLIDQAEKLRATTGVDDAAIMQIQQLGAGAGYSTEFIKKLTNASVQLAAKTGQDLQSAYMQLNMTMTGSAGRLNRLDTDFGKLSETQLKNGGAIDLVITKYGTFAQNTAKQTDILKSNFDELTESVGYAFAEGSLSPFLSGLNSAIVLATKLMNTLAPDKIKLSGEQFDRLTAFSEAWKRQKESLTDSEWADNYRKKVKLINDEWNKASNALGTFENKILANENASFFNKQQITKEGQKQQEQERERLSQSILFRKTELEQLEIINKGVGGFKNQNKEIITGISALEKWINTMNEASRKAQEMAQFDVPIPSFSGAGYSDVVGTTGKGISGMKGQIGDPSKLAARGQQVLGETVKKTNSELQAQINSMTQMQSIMGGFAEAATTAFGEQSAAAKAFAVGQVIAQAAMGIMATWAGYAEFGPVGTALAVAQTAMIGGLAITQLGNIAGAFAQGGIVGGGSYSGDNITARVNSGEMILNGNQQRELFAMANGMGNRNQVEVVGYISGDVIRLANKRGEYMHNRRG